MTADSHFIENSWLEGEGLPFDSNNPVNGEVVWRGRAATVKEIDRAVAAARQAQPAWGALNPAVRMTPIRRFGEQLAKEAESFARTISLETGKPLWEAKAEVASLVESIDISYRAYRERSGERGSDSGGVRARVRHRAHGVAAVFGPWSAPAQLPGRHILPALIAGNTVVFKPSELAPLVAASMVRMWQQAGLPGGVMNLVQGGRTTGSMLSRHPGLDALFLTGSTATGRQLNAQFAGDTRCITALQMGGNNPLLVWRTERLDAAACVTVQSAYLSAGQRCTSARRLIIPRGVEGNRFLEQLKRTIAALSVGAPDDRPEPFMGPLIDNAAADRLLKAQAHLVALGAVPIAAMERTLPGRPFLKPGLLDCSGVRDAPDEEYFGPLLQLYRADDLRQAIEIANRTRCGLAAGVLSDSASVYDSFYRHSRAGIVNWNRSLTDAGSDAPLGGTGASGNHRPGGYYAADYCAYPVASLESGELVMPKEPLPGLNLS